jgi:hypothetical protein
MGRDWLRLMYYGLHTVVYKIKKMTNNQGELKTYVVRRAITETIVEKTTIEATSEEEAIQLAEERSNDIDWREDSTDSDGFNYFID